MRNIQQCYVGMIDIAAIEECVCHVRGIGQNHDQERRRHSDALGRTIRGPLGIISNKKLDISIL